MKNRFFSAVLSVGLFSAAVAVQAATLEFSAESTGFYFDKLGDTWTGSFEVNSGFDNSGVVLSAQPFFNFSFEPFLVVWDSAGNQVGSFDRGGWPSSLDLGLSLSDGLYSFTISNWPYMPVSSTSTFGEGYALPAYYPGTINDPTIPVGMGRGDWQVTITGVVPEPETWAMLLAGLAMVGTVARRRKQR
jgi:hypothetical protein